MSGITKILTRTPGELGSIKTNKSPIVEENKQLPAEQWNTAADAIIEIQTVIGEAANPGDGTITKVLGDHEERISELEQNGGGGSSDRIESESGAAFAEATDDFLGMGTSAVLSRTNHSSGSAIAYTAILPGEGGPSHPVLMASIAATNADETQSAGIGAQYDPTTEEFRLRATGAPLQVDEPIASNHAATKGYVDARPGAEEWSEHPATQDVDMDGHRITSLGAPVADSDAATKQYVDDAVAGGGGDTPSKIENPSGGAVFETTDSYMGSGVKAAYARVGTREAGNSFAEIVFADANLEGGPGKAIVVVLGRETSENYNDRSIGLSYDSTNDEWHGDISFNLNLYATPTDPSHLINKGYVDAQRTLVEWWEPVWTPVSNVDSVSNVECQYTRTYRTAGGSLVTLEGTIEVTPDAADTMTMVSVDLPVPRDGVDMVAGIGSFSDYDGDDFGLARVGVADLGAGQQVALQYTPSTDAVHRVSFRVSYRAA